MVEYLAPVTPELDGLPPGPAPSPTPSPSPVPTPTPTPPQVPESAHPAPNT